MNVHGPCLGAFLFIFLLGCGYTVLKHDPKPPEPPASENEEIVDYEAIAQRFIGSWQGVAIWAMPGPSIIDTIYRLEFFPDETWSLKSERHMVFGTWSLEVAGADTHLVTVTQSDRRILRGGYKAEFRDTTLLLSSSRFQSGCDLRLTHKQ